MSQPLSDRPVRRGKVYCSPACGGGEAWGCTLAKHNKAQQDATKLCLAIGGAATTWTPHVWENLGWHYCAISPCGRIKVHPRHAGFTAYLGEAGSSGGRWYQSARTARAAIRKVVERGIRERAEVDELLRNLPFIGGRELAPKAKP